MDTILIDAKKALKPWHIQQFKENQADDVNVVMYIEHTQAIFERPLKDMRKFFEDEEVEKNVSDDNCVISFMTDAKVLQILGIDYNWWIAVIRGKKYRRLEKLFPDACSEEPIKNQSENLIKPPQERKTSKKRNDSQTIFKCACGIKNGEQIEDIETFEGTYKETIAFINRQNQIRQIRSFFKAEIVFCVNCDASEKNWFTVNELIEKGVFVI